MVAFAILTKFRSLVGLAAAATLFSSNPAMANASANADILAPLRAATAAKQDNAATAGDSEFRSLFKSWSALEGSSRKLVSVSQPVRGSGAASGITATPAFALPTSVAIPSRIPVDGVALTSGFGMRWHPVVGGRRAHKGVDLGAPSGTPIYASADGVVSRADWYSSYGLYVSIEHGGEIETRYGHMSRINAYAGQVVKKGDLIGYVGSTGRSTGPHLHYEVRIAGTAVNPIPYLQDGAYKPATLAQAEAIGGQGDGEE